MVLEHAATGTPVFGSGTTAHDDLTGLPQATDDDLDDLPQAATLQADPLMGADPQYTPELRAAHERVKRGLFGAAAAPRQIGKYVVLEMLGHGGMGAVYAVYNPALDRRSVIKLVLPGSSSATARRRLVQEAWSMARMPVHPNIVQVFDAGEHEDEVFVVMEYIDGVNLAKWQEQAARPWSEVLAVYLEAGRGLAAIHQHGLTHRDFKPSNVMRSAAGRVCVLDFGLAHARHEDSTAVAPTRGAALDAMNDTTAGGASVTRDDRLTPSDAAVGTPRYMSPEQAYGHSDPRSDQFSFCVALWEALFGDLPFAGGFLHAYVITGELAAPDPKRGVPRRVVAALRRGLAIEPGRRHPSMAALLAALSPPERRRRAAWLLAAGLAAGLASWWSPPAPTAAERCASELAGELAGVWDDERQAQVRGALTTSDRGPAILRRLDEQATLWRTVRTGMCAAHREGALSAALLARGVACLDHHRRVLGDVADGLAAGGPSADLDLGELPGQDRLEACADPLHITDPAPPSPGARAAVERIATALPVAEARLILGQYEDSEATAARAVDEARAAQHGPTLAAALYHLARARTYGPHAADAHAELLEAARLADLHDLHDLAADIQLRILRVLSSHGERQADARVWYDVLTAKLTRLDERHGWREATAREHLGDLALQTGDLAAAEAHYMQAAAWTADASPFTRSRMQSGLGRVRRAQLKLDEAQVRFTDALRLAEEELGPTHPKLVVLLDLIAGTELDRAALAGDGGQPERAREPIARALALVDAGPRRPHAAALVHYTAARLALLGGDLEQASRLVDLARQEIHAPALSHDLRIYRASILDLVAAVALARDDPRAALTAGLELLATSAAEQDAYPDDWLVAYFNAAQSANQVSEPRLALRFIGAARELLHRPARSNLDRRMYTLVLVGEEAKALTALGRVAAASDALQLALVDWRPDRPEADPFADEVAWQLFELLRTQSSAEAEPHARRLRARLAVHPPADGDRLARLDLWLRTHSPRRDPP